MSTIFRPPRIIDFGRLRLRPFTRSDAPMLFDCLLGDPDVTAWLAFRTHRSTAESETFIEDTQRGWTSGHCFTWALEDSESARIVAAIEVRPALPRAELGVITSFQEGYRKRRAGLLALLKLIDWLMSQPNLWRLHAYCAPEGKAASTMTRLGFTLEGRLSHWEPRPNQNIAAGDALLFAITRSPAESMPGTAARYHRLARHDLVVRE